MPSRGGRTRLGEPTLQEPRAARVTRRAVLGGFAGAAAASVLHASPSVAAPLGYEPSVFSLAVGALAGGSGELTAPRRFELVGVEWSSPPHVRIELRTRARGGAWSRWASASTLGHEPDQPAARGALFGEAIWCGDAEYVELRTSRPVRAVRLHFVSHRVPQGDAAAAALPLAQPVLDAGPGQPPIIARTAWAMGQAPPAMAPYYGAIELAFVHHTQSLNGYSPGEVPAALLAIFDYHRYVRGFWDIAYNFMIDDFGRIWEARAGGIDRAVIGAHAGDYNAISTGVAVLGSFIDIVPPPAALDALERLLAWKMSLHGVPTHGRVTVVVDPAGAFYTPFAPGAHVSLPRVAGHRDGDSTDCPGDAFYARLPGLRPRITALAGSPAKLTLDTPPTMASAAVPVVLSGRLARLAGAPLAGAPIELQSLPSGGTESTLARVTTAADGFWSATVELIHSASLRALHRLPPATVSVLAEVNVAPAITLTVDSLAPLEVSGTISPGKRAATIDLYALGSPRRAPITSQRTPVVQGRFAARIATPRAGTYRLVARTAGDPLNAVGHSPAVVVTV